MSDYNRYGHGYGAGSGGYGHTPPPSAPPAPIPTTSAPPSSSSSYGYGYGQGGYPSAYPPQPAAGFGFGYGPAPVAFPPGTHPDVERAFRTADRDCSGAIDENELQGALSTAYHRFSIRTVRLLMFLFNDPASSTPSRMGKAIPPLSILNSY
jgi:calcium-binding protein CML